jgi:alkaline phosphatase
MGRGGGRTSALNIGRGPQSIGLIDPLGIWGPACNYVSNVLATDPIAYWILGEGVGTVAYDEITDPTHLDINQSGDHSNVTLGQPGIGDGNTCPLYDGATSRTNVYTATLNGNFDGAEGTALIWVKVANLGVWTDGTIRAALKLHVNNDNQITMYRDGNNNNFELIYEAGTVIRNLDIGGLTSVDWLVFAISWSATADEVRFFMDGVQQGAALNGLGVWAGNLNVDRTNIGCLQANTQVWSGYEAHCILWDSAIAPTTIALLSSVDCSAFRTPSGVEQARIGLFADTHYADKATAGDRHYRDGDDKLADAVAVFNADGGIDAVIQCADLIDGWNNTDKPQTLTDLGVIEDVYDNLTMSRYYVLGNHELEDLTKAEFIANTGMTSNYGYVDVGDVRIIWLDACFLSDDDANPYIPGSGWATSYIPPDERSWLQNTALNTSRECLVFCHQLLDGDDPGGYYVLNSTVVRGILEAAGNVHHVFCGHRHEESFSWINGIVYHRVEAMTEDAYPENAYAILVIYQHGWLDLIGYGKEASYTVRATN